MFYNCNKLSSLTVGFTEWEPSGVTNATNNWVNGITTSGTFICPDKLPEEKGVNRIPTNWKTNKHILIIDVGVDGYLDLTLNNNTLIANNKNSQGRSWNDPGTHRDLNKNFKHVYFGHHACLVGMNENNLSKWNIDETSWVYTLPFNANNIVSIELIYSGRNLPLTGTNQYSNSSDSLTLDNNKITIIDDDSSSSEYKFKITFD